MSSSASDSREGGNWTEKVVISTYLTAFFLQNLMWPLPRAQYWLHGSLLTWWDCSARKFALIQPLVQFSLLSPFSFAGRFQRQSDFCLVFLTWVREYNRYSVACSCDHRYLLFLGRISKDKVSSLNYIHSTQPNHITSILPHYTRARAHGTKLFKLHCPGPMFLLLEVSMLPFLSNTLIRAPLFLPSFTHVNSCKFTCNFFFVYTKILGHEVLVRTLVEAKGWIKDL